MIECNCGVDQNAFHYIPSEDTQFWLLLWSLSLFGFLCVVTWAHEILLIFEIYILAMDQSLYIINKYYFYYLIQTDWHIAEQKLVWRARVWEFWKGRVKSISKTWRGSKMCWSTGKALSYMATHRQIEMG